MHYQRLTKIGTIDQPIATAPDEERFWARVDRSGGLTKCWPWLAGAYPSGYGHMWWEGRSELAHRIAYTLSRKPIPSGRQWNIDHLCRNRICQNPDHLELVTRKENILRGISHGAVNNRKTHCIHGHEFTPENTYHPPKRPHHRYCRACAYRRARQQRSGVQ